MNLPNYTQRLKKEIENGIIPWSICYTITLNSLLLISWYFFFLILTMISVGYPYRTLSEILIYGSRNQNSKIKWYKKRNNGFSFFFGGGGGEGNI